MKQKNRAAFFLQLVHLLLLIPLPLLPQAPAPAPAPVATGAVLLLPTLAHLHRVSHQGGIQQTAQPKKIPLSGGFLIQIGRPSVEGLFIWIFHFICQVVALLFGEILCFPNFCLLRQYLKHDCQNLLAVARLKLQFFYHIREPIDEILHL